jgi:heme-degrading monooxygenase HmoA
VAEEVGIPYTSGNWVVRAGSEKDFIAQWSDFTQWSFDNAPGARSFVLIQHAENPSRFLSFGAWDDADSVAGWRQQPEFAERLGRCRALCDEFQAGDYTVVSSLGGEANG